MKFITIWFFYKPDSHWREDCFKVVSSDEIILVYSSKHMTAISDRDLTRNAHSRKIVYGPKIFLFFNNEAYCADENIQYL